MIEVLQALYEQLNTVEELNYIDEDWGQLDSYGNDCPVKWPCCIIDIQSSDFSDIGRDRSAEPQNRQQGISTIVLRVANLKLTNSSLKAPVFQKEKAFKIHRIIEQVHKKIHGFRPVPGHDNLIRVNLRKVRRDDGIQEYLITYSIGLNNV
ncbi:hypothetical protein GCM10007424_23640 [Flavobacterium suaedae]|uniref:Uncharacterized protein n=1 Tax=Flavobacterium suaedae TaxID=1767027 RepID=A0ABQ1K3B1_9FLAO|nr:hypothetical protein [Flavobacterium suaedae]GGB82885.1 hypothetical protein GCM10007424_23640 [Flavobacterium suaedae]